METNCIKTKSDSKHASGNYQLVYRSTYNNGKTMNQRVNNDTKVLNKNAMKLKEKSKRPQIDINSICKEINSNEEKASLPNIDKDNSSLWLVKANETMEKASKIKDRVSLYKGLWHEGEICVLFAKSNLGKSILAVQIANEIAKSGKLVNYLDYELDDKQFQGRYTNEITKEMFIFSNNLLRADLSIDRTLKYQGRLERFFEKVEKMGEIGIKVIILDNITSLVDKIENGDVIIEFIRRLKLLKEKYELSILIVAHTTKRRDSEPLNQDSLAGSKKLMNFIDSSFALGKSLVETDVIYLKQLKVRAGKHIYNEDNVLLCKIIKKNNFLHFVECGYAVEKDLLNTKKSIAKVDKKELILASYSLFKNGNMSYRQIGKELGVSDKTIAKWIKQVETTKAFATTEEECLINN